MTVDFSAIQRFEVSLGTAGTNIVSLAKAAVAKTAYDLQAQAMARCPVDTGNLRSSITVELDPSGLAAEVGPTAHYGAHVEYGTVRMAPQPYMQPAIDAVMPGYLAAMQQIGKM